MVKIIAILKNDLQARAGQLLMQLDDGQIVAADMPGIQAVAKPKPIATAIAPAPTTTSKLTDARAHKLNSLPDNALISAEELSFLANRSRTSLWRDVRRKLLAAPVAIGSQTRRWRVADVRAYLAGEGSLKPKRADRSSNEEDVLRLIGRGHNLADIARRTGLARSTVTKIYNNLTAEGHIKQPHHWFKSVEELEKARQRGAAIGSKNKKNGVSHA